MRSFNNFPGIGEIAGVAANNNSSNAFDNSHGVIAAISSDVMMYAGNEWYEYQIHVWRV